MSIEAVREKGFTATSIQDITERARVHRGAFYAHFTDKYALLDTIIHESIQQLLANKLPSTSRWNRETLHLLIRTMLEYFESKYRHHPYRPSHDITPLVEQATREELSKLLLLWLKQNKSEGEHWRASPETVARVVSWGIFGAAIEWSQEESTISLNQMANDVLQVIMDGMAQLAPEALPE